MSLALDPRIVQAVRDLRNDFPSYARKCLRIRTKSGTVEPLILNAAQTYIHNRLQEQLRETGKIRAVILKGRQQGCCLDPESKVLTADLRWVAIKDLVVGQELVACDEQAGGARGAIRKLRTSTVEKIWRVKKHAYRITLDDGRTLVCSGQHRWLTKQSPTDAHWASVEGKGAFKKDLGRIRIGDHLRSITTPWGLPDLDDAWFGGMLDGEGSLDFLTRTGADLAVTQTVGPVLSKMQDHCLARGFTHCSVKDPRKDVYSISISGMSHIFRVIGLSRPVRFVGKRWWDGKRMPDNGWRKVVSIEPLGEMELVDIQTDLQTYVAEGIVSHNSTYTEGRLYWRTSLQNGKRAFILTHDAEATSTIFELAKRYHEHVPNVMRPSISASNARELIFDKLDSGYKVGTAGSKAVGRGSTIQYLHGSEVAFWPNAEEHFAGLMQAIPSGPDTEVILESTANGVGGLYHRLWQEAEAGQSEYQAVFVPWYWQDEYVAATDDDFNLDPDEADYANAYNLTLGQMAWRRAKIKELGDPLLFRQEYPATPSEAFVVTGIDSFITSDIIAVARRELGIQGSGPVVVGVDPAREGKDRTSIIFRQGRKAWGLRYLQNKDNMDVAGVILGILKAATPYVERVFVDIGGGAGIVDRLHEMGYRTRVRAINFGSKATDPVRDRNKRTEMWREMRDWLAQELPVSIPDDNALHADLSAPSYKYTSSNQLLLESKEDMRKRGLRSPDGGDALALTFAEPVITPEMERPVLRRPGRARRAPTQAGY